MADGMAVLQNLVRQAVKRNEILSSNIANVDTPNYHARDVKFDQVLGNEMSMAVTNPKHIQASSSGGGSGEVTGEDSQPWADKNNVELDMEVAKMTENAMLFEAGMTLIKKRVQMFKSALKTS